jgi:hypothetical protein
MDIGREVERKSRGKGWRKKEHDSMINCRTEGETRRERLGKEEIENTDIVFRIV